MDDFESFMNDQREQATQPAAPQPPPDFETFMNRVKGEHSWMEVRPSERLGPSPEPIAPEQTTARDEPTAKLIALRKRESVMTSLLECLGAG